MVRKRVNFNGLTSFLAVMETGSFTGAARALGLSKSVVSKQVADLERELGITLLVRSARCSTPTTVGALFHRQSLLGMDALDLAVLGARGQAMTPQGELRVVSNPGYGRAVVLPVILAFSKCYPACMVSLRLADSADDVMALPFDIMVRTRELPDSMLQVRRIAGFSDCLVAGKTLEANVTAIENPCEASHLPFIGHARFPDRGEWTFIREQEDVTVRFEPVMELDPADAILDAVMAGAGIAVLPDFMLRAPEVSKRIVRVAPAWKIVPGNIYAYTTPTPQRSAALRVFLEWLDCAVRDRPFPLPEKPLLESSA